MEAGIIDQKENDPSLARDEIDRITNREVTDSNAKLNFAQQVGAPQLPQSQQPLRVRNMATQSQNQTQLLEKFRKLRQWQQQQQESMLRQQQQAMETLKMEQSQLQSILAAQRKLQEQQNISSMTVRLPLSEEDARKTGPLIMHNQPQQLPRIQNVSSDLVGQTTTDVHGTISMSSLLPVSGNSVSSLNLEELTSRIQEMKAGLVSSQKPSEVLRHQVVANGEQRLDESITSFNATVYPMMWNSPNYHLPIEATPLSAGTKSMYLQGQPVDGYTSAGSLMPHIGISTNRMHEVAQGCQSLNSSEELERLRKYNSVTEVQSHLEMCDLKDKEKRHTPVMVPQHLRLQRLWSRNPGVQLLASVETNAEEHSEADAMSGVYPLYDSESEMGVNEVDDKETGDEEMDAESNDEESEESIERDKTVIDLHSESDGKTEQPQEESHTEVDEEMRPIKPGIGGGSSVKNFEELLDQQLKLEASKLVAVPEVANQKPQRTFLRKGQGLARFKGKSTSNKTVGQPKGSGSQSATVTWKEKKTGNPVPSLSQGNNKLVVPNGAPVMLGKVTRKVASKSPQVPTEAFQEAATRWRLQSKGSVGPKTQSTSREGIMVTTACDERIPASQSVVFTRAEATSNPSGLLNSIDASFQMRLQELEEKQEIEEEELEEFELLEQAAANASFSSNSSVVVKVLAKARGNALDGKHVGQGQSVTNNRGPGGILSPVDTGYGSGDGKVISSVDHHRLTRIDALRDNDSENEEGDITLQEMSLDSALELDHGAVIKYETALNNQQKGPVHLTPTLSVAIEDEFNDEEAWGEIKKQAEANTKKEKNDNDDDDDFDEDDDDSDVTISDIFPLITSTPPAHLKGGDAQRHQQAVNSRVDGMTASTPPTSALVTKLFPQLKPKQKASSPTKQSVSGQAPQNRPGEGKAEDSTEAVQSIAVRQKLKELENEIDKFRSENAALAKMRAEREEGLKKIQTEITTFEKQKTEELERLEQFREEELRKLRRERRVFEKYQKAARTVPDKKEREEIEALRAQVAELQEELKRREARWSAASTRSRQRIEALEQEKKELQDEVKLLEQYRLQQWREDEQTKARVWEEQEIKAKKPLQRKIAKTTEEESLTRLLPSRPSPPLRSDVVESVPWSTPEDTVVGPENRLTALGTDANDNQSGGLRQGETPSPDTSPDLNEERSETASIRTTERDNIIETQPSKRSPRRRSKTPDSSEKIKRSVHFRDENTLQQNDPAEVDRLSERTGRQDQREIMHSDGKVEKVNSDGSRVITFANGTRKDISADGQTIIVTFFNGDIKQIMPDQRVIYYYSEAQTTHTTYPDGLEVLQFPSKQIEKHYPDGTREIIFPDQTIKYLHPNGAEECVFSDGTIQKVCVDGARTIEFPNGQRETHTKYYKKREYPDGTVKTVYPDGRTETRYATGRVRVKDREGRVLVDSQSNQIR